MTYIIEFTQDGVKKRTKVNATSEYYARKALLDKASGNVLIDSCKDENPFQNAKDIISFLKGFSK